MYFTHYTVAKRQKWRPPSNAQFETIWQFVGKKASAKSAANLNKSRHNCMNDLKSINFGNKTRQRHFVSTPLTCLYSRQRPLKQTRDRNDKEKKESFRTYKILFSSCMKYDTHLDCLFGVIPSSLADEVLSSTLLKWMPT